MHEMIRDIIPFHCLSRLNGSLGKVIHGFDLAVLVSSSADELLRAEASGFNGIFSVKGSPFSKSRMLFDFDFFTGFSRGLSLGTRFWRSAVILSVGARRACSAVRLELA